MPQAFKVRLYMYPSLPWPDTHIEHYYRLTEASGSTYHVEQACLSIQAQSLTMPPFISPSPLLLVTPTEPLVLQESSREPVTEASIETVTKASNKTVTGGSNETVTHTKTINVQRGKSLSSMTNFAAITLDVENPESMLAKDLRAKLGSDMYKNDRFLTAGGFPLTSETEASLTIKKLFAESTESKSKSKSKSNDEETKVSDKHSAGSTESKSNDEETTILAESVQVIRILARDEKEPVKLGDWPKDVGFWSSDIMNDAVLPPSHLVRPAEPGKEANLGVFLDVNAFGILQWTELIKINNLLKGVRMSASGPRASAYPIAAAPPAFDKFYTFRNPNAYITTESSDSEYTTKLMSQGWTSASLSVGTPFFSAEVQGKTHSMTASNQVSTHIFTTASYKYAFVTIVFDPATLTPSESFVTAIKTIMDNKNTNEHVKAQDLRKVFNRYGQIFQTEVTLGAMLTTTDSKSVETKADQTKFEWEVKAKLSASIPSFQINIGGGFGMGSSTDQIQKEMTQDEKTTITAHGGNPLLSTALAQWIPSVADYRTWRTIEVSDAVPTTEFVPEEYRAEVVRISGIESHQDKPLRGRWVRPIIDQENKGAESKVSQFKTYRPPIHEGWCYLGQSIDRQWALLVKDNMIKGTEGALPALAPFSDADLIQQNAGSSATDWESFWMLRPKDTDNYAILGNYYNTGTTSYVQPDMDQSPLNLMRAVRKDLCVETTLEKESYWSNKNATDTERVSVWKPAWPAVDGRPHYGFRAFQTSSDNWNAISNDPGSHIWVLKASSIYIEPDYVK